jgi:hypothetical protein
MNSDNYSFATLKTDPHASQRAESVKAKQERGAILALANDRSGDEGAP